MRRCPWHGPGTDSCSSGAIPRSCGALAPAECHDALLPRQESSSQTRNHGTTPPYGRELPPGRARKGEVDSASLFRVFRWIPWLISDPPGAAIDCCWTESAVRVCADLGCRGNTAGSHRSRASCGRSCRARKSIKARTLAVSLGFRAMSARYTCSASFSRPKRSKRTAPTLIWSGFC